jgi:hypothetical protein
MLFMHARINAGKSETVRLASSDGYILVAKVPTSLSLFSISLSQYLFGGGGFMVS